MYCTHKALPLHLFLCPLGQISPIVNLLPPCAHTYIHLNTPTQNVLLIKTPKSLLVIYRPGYASIGFGEAWTAI